jgi:hypothetical protein
VPGDDEPQRLLLTPAEVVRLLNVDARDLARMRARGEGPTFRRLGGRLIRYDATSTRSWGDARDQS